MATTTPNFGWPVPTSTDLVKDGATAIEALGDSIDASLLDLKGGTTGQVLSKNSNTDMDFIWVTDAAGDITGVTAGTGISGGGTSGTVTVTNSMATAIDAKGDLVAGTGADAFARLGVGTNGQVLTADSAETTGLKWTTPTAGSTQTYAVFTDQKTQNTNGGTFTSGAFRTRDINTTQYNNISGASIASNQITLAAGTYSLSAKCTAAQVLGHGARLYNITDSSVTIVGKAQYSDSAALYATNESIVEGIFTIAGSKTFEIQHRSAATISSYGFGIANNFQAEVYTVVSIVKL
jgi:hypothetical protein